MLDAFPFDNEFEVVENVGSVDQEALCDLHALPVSDLPDHEEEGNGRKVGPSRYIKGSPTPSVATRTERAQKNTSCSHNGQGNSFTSHNSFQEATKEVPTSSDMFQSSDNVLGRLRNRDRSKNYGPPPSRKSYDHTARKNAIYAVVAGMSVKRAAELYNLPEIAIRNVFYRFNYHQKYRTDGFEDVHFSMTDSGFLKSVDDANVESYFENSLGDIPSQSLTDDMAQYSESGRIDCHNEPRLERMAKAIEAVQTRRLTVASAAKSYKIPKETLKKKSKQTSHYDEGSEHLRYCETNSTIARAGNQVRQKDGGHGQAQKYIVERHSDSARSQYSNAPKIPINDSVICNDQGNADQVDDDMMRRVDVPRKDRSDGTSRVRFSSTPKYRSRSYSPAIIKAVESDSAGVTSDFHNVNEQLLRSRLIEVLPTSSNSIPGSSNVYHPDVPEPSKRRRLESCYTTDCVLSARNQRGEFDQSLISGDFAAERLSDVNQPCETNTRCLRDRISSLQESASGKAHGQFNCVENVTGSTVNEATGEIVKKRGRGRPRRDPDAKKVKRGRPRKIVPDRSTDGMGSQNVESINTDESSVHVGGRDEVGLDVHGEMTTGCQDMENLGALGKQSADEHQDLNIVESLTEPKGSGLRGSPLSERRLTKVLRARILCKRVSGLFKIPKSKLEEKQSGASMSVSPIIKRRPGRPQKTSSIHVDQRNNGCQQNTEETHSLRHLRRGRRISIETDESRGQFMHSEAVANVRQFRAGGNTDEPDISMRLRCRKTIKTKPGDQRSRNFKEAITQAVGNGLPSTTKYKRGLRKKEPGRPSCEDDPKQSTKRNGSLRNTACHGFGLSTSFNESPTLEVKINSDLNAACLSNVGPIIKRGRGRPRKTNVSHGNMMKKGCQQRKTVKTHSLRHLRSSRISMETDETRDQSTHSAADGGDVGQINGGDIANEPDISMRLRCRKIIKISPGDQRSRNLLVATPNVGKEPPSTTEHGRGLETKESGLTSCEDDTSTIPCNASLRNSVSHEVEPSSSDESHTLEVKPNSHVNEAEKDSELVNAINGLIPHVKANSARDETGKRKGGRPIKRKRGRPRRIVKESLSDVSAKQGEPSDELSRMETPKAEVLPNPSACKIKFGCDSNFENVSQSFLCSIPNKQPGTPRSPDTVHGISTGGEVLEGQSQGPDTLQGMSNITQSPCKHEIDCPGSEQEISVVRDSPADGVLGCELETSFSSLTPEILCGLSHTQESPAEEIPIPSEHSEQPSKSILDGVFSSKTCFTVDDSANHSATRSFSHPKSHSETPRPSGIHSLSRTTPESVPLYVQTTETPQSLSPPDSTSIVHSSQHETLNAISTLEMPTLERPVGGSDTEASNFDISPGHLTSTDTFLPPPVLHPCSPIRSDGTCSTHHSQGMQLNVVHLNGFPFAENDGSCNEEDPGTGRNSSRISDVSSGSSTGTAEVAAESTKGVEVDGTVDADTDLPFLRCAKCCYQTQNESLFRAHVDKHSLDSEFRCPLCDFHESDSDKFVEHWASHHVGRSLACHVCRRKITSGKLKRHILVHKTVSMYDCSICEFSTNYVDTIKRHTEAFHAKMHKCGRCGLIMTKHELQRHHHLEQSALKSGVVPAEIISGSSRPDTEITAVGGTPTSQSFQGVSSCGSPHKYHTSPLKPGTNTSQGTESVGNLFAKESRQTAKDTAILSHTSAQSSEEAHARGRSPTDMEPLTRHTEALLNKEYLCTQCNQLMPKPILLRHMESSECSRQGSSQQTSEMPSRRSLRVAIKVSELSLALKNKASQPSQQQFSKSSTKNPTDKTTYTCDWCDYSTEYIGNVRRHVENMHKKLVSCMQCKEVMTKYNLRLHMMAAHGCVESKFKSILGSHPDPKPQITRAIAISSLGSLQTIQNSKTSSAGSCSSQLSQVIGRNENGSNPMEVSFASLPASHHQVTLDHPYVRPTDSSPIPSSSGVSLMQGSKVSKNSQRSLIDPQEINASGHQAPSCFGALFATNMGDTKELNCDTSSHTALANPVLTSNDAAIFCAPVDVQRHSQQTKLVHRKCAICSSSTSSKHHEKQCTNRTMLKEVANSTKKVKQQFSISSRNMFTNIPGVAGFLHLFSKESFGLRKCSVPLERLPTFTRALSSKHITKIEKSKSKAKGKSKGNAVLDTDFRVVSGAKIFRKTMQCSKCVFNTKRRRLLKRHVAKHLEDLRFSCPYCGFKELNGTVFTNHIVQHQGDRTTFDCCFCDQKLKHKHSLNEHFRKHRSVALFDCSECLFSTYRPDLLKCHVIRNHRRASRHKIGARKSMRFRSASRRFRIAKRARSLGLDQAEDLPLVTSDIQCPEPATEATVIEQPAVYRPDGERGSGEPGKKYLDTEKNSTASLTLPLETSTPLFDFQKPLAKPVKPQFYCSKCSFRTRIKSFLKHHKAKHLIADRFVCTKCDVKDSSNWKFAKHWLSHCTDSNESIQCCYCNSKFKKEHCLKGSLARHLSKHRDLDLVGCLKCTFSSSDQDKLEKHYQQHHAKRRRSEVYKKTMPKESTEKTVNSGQHVSEGPCSALLDSYSAESGEADVVEHHLSTSAVMPSTANHRNPLSTQGESKPEEMATSGYQGGGNNFVHEVPIGLCDSEAAGSETVDPDDVIDPTSMELNPGTDFCVPNSEHGTNLAEGFVESDTATTRTKPIIQCIFNQDRAVINVSSDSEDSYGSSHVDCELVDHETSAPAFDLRDILKERMKNIMEVPSLDDVLPACRGLTSENPKCSEQIVDLANGLNSQCQSSVTADLSGIGEVQASGEPSGSPSGERHSAPASTSVEQSDHSSN